VRRVGLLNSEFLILNFYNHLVLQRALAVLLISGAAQGVFAQPRPAVTFTRDIAPLLFTHCATCHRPGGSAASSLLTFDEARRRARQIVTMTASHAMPPWKPESGFGEFEGERRLTDPQIALFQRWVEDGLQEGKHADLPKMPEWPSGWELGPPDLILTMPEYTLRAGGPDMFRNFVIPVPTASNRFVRAWEFHPGNRVVHHATMQVDTEGASRRFDEQDPDGGYEGLIAPSARAPDGFFLDWAPGHRPSVAVEGTAWPLPKASDLVMMLHLRPSGKEEKVQATIGLYFSDTPPAKVPVMVRLNRQDLDIPAGERQFRTTDSFTLPVDVDVYTVQPHAHYLAHEMRGTARLPNGTIKPLIYIKAWDFDWQDVYHYASPVFLPKGSTLSMDFTYDNSSGNVRNPHTPPVRVTYGQQTSDEMAELWFQVVPRNASDRAALTRSLSAKVLPEEIKGRQMMVAKDPGNVALHDDLALMYVESGRTAAAVDEFRVSLKLRPDSAAARFNVGAALLAAGDRRGARPYFEQALQADPAHAMAHNDLGALLQADGDLPGAMAHYRQALQLAPNDAEIQLTAGVGFATTGDRASALAHLREALNLKPDWPNAQAALASVIADSPASTTEDLKYALTLAERAVEATGGKNAAFVDILAATRRAQK
jgi:Tfp pilus assembly protein PilF/mono/diheme cytochrome c family protein